MYEHQIEAKEKIKENDKKNENSLLQLPTGTGKTRILIEEIKERINKGQRVLIVVPTKLLRDNVWMKEFAKWGINPQKFVPLDGSLGPYFWLRKKWYQDAKKEGKSIIITPITLSNDRDRGWIDFNDFDKLYLDEAANVVALGYKGWRLNYNYRFLLDWDGKLITGATIDSENSRIKATRKLLKAKKVDSKKARAPKVITKIINVPNPELQEIVDLVSKNISYARYTIKNILGIEIEKNLNKFNYLIKKHKNIPEIQKLEESQKIKLFLALKIFSEMTFLKQLLYDDQIYWAKCRIMNFLVDTKDKIYRKTLTKILKKIDKIKPRKTMQILENIKKLVKNGKLILLVTRYRNTVRGYNRILQECGIKSGIIWGGLDNPQRELEHHLKNGCKVILMTAKTGAEGLNLPFFDVLIHTSPFSSKFTRDQIKGRIRGGLEYYFVYGDCKEDKRLNIDSLVESEELSAEYIRKITEPYFKIYFVCERISENEFKIVKILDKKIHNNKNHIIVPVLSNSIPELSKNKQFLGKFGEELIKIIWELNGYKVFRIYDLWKYHKFFSTEEIQFLKKVKSTIDFVAIKGNEKHLLEVKTSLGKNSNISPWQRELLSYGEKLGFKTNEVTLIISSDDNTIKIKYKKDG